MYKHLTGKMKLNLLIVWIFAHLELVSCTENLNGDRFYQALKDLAEKILGVDRIQDYLDNRVEYDSPMQHNGQEILDDIVGNLDTMFRRVEDAVWNLQDNVQKAIDSEVHVDNVESTPAQCCSAQGLNSTNKAFPKRKVNVDEMCITGSSSASEEGAPNLDEFLKAAKDNSEKIPELKWQYVAFEENYLTIYPSTKLASCSQEDNPIMSTWYKEGASPKPKNIVLVCDKSNSMNGNLMDYAKAALRAVLHTLVPNDR